MRTIWRGTIAFGLVSIPVGVVVAQDQGAGTRMHRVSRTSGARVRNVAWDPVEDRPLTRGDTVAAREVEPGRFATIERETVRALRAGPLPEGAASDGSAPPPAAVPPPSAAAAPEPDEVLSRPPPPPHTLAVESFVPLGDVPPEIYDRAYWLAPQPDGLRPYRLLQAALAEEGRAAVCRVVLRERERLALVRAADDLLVLHVLHWPEDVRSADRARLAAPLAGTPVTDEERELARRLVRYLEAGWDADAHRDAARARIDAHLRAQVPQAPPAAEAPPGPAPPDALVEALRASLEASRHD